MGPLAERRNARDDEHMKASVDPRSILANASAYSGLARMLSKGGGVPRLPNLLEIRPNESVLDLGCGPAAILGALPDVTYCGIDVSPRYLADARAKFGHRARFVERLFTAQADLSDLGRFDHVIAVGLLHHLDDETAMAVCRAARMVLRTGGRFTALDPALIERQNPFARFAVKLDRGRFVRMPNGYRHLASLAFASVTATVLHDLLRIPYTHVLLRAH
jgi:SAM-dependent methyltransferase